MEKLFLQTLFDEVKKRINPHLSIADYLVLLEAVVQQGIGLDNHRDLENLCALLWLKSKPEQDAFRLLFANFLVDLELKLEATRQQKKVETKIEDKEDFSKKEKEKIAEKTDNQQIPSGNINQNKEENQSETAPKTEFEEGNINVAWNFQDLIKTESPTPYKNEGRYLMNLHYHPFAQTQRELQQQWRRLRQLKSYNTSHSEELNVAATVKDIAQKGYFEQAIYHKKYLNEYSLTVLIDRKGSMLAFHALSDFMVETIKKEIPNANIYYFRNQPQEYFYGSPDWTQAITKDDLIKKINKNNANVLIISDSGAARGTYLTSRLQAWWRFFNSIKGSINQSAWFNPMPQTRWANSTAIYIAKLIPMLEISEDENSIKKIIQSLRRVEVMR